MRNMQTFRGETRFARFGSVSSHPRLLNILPYLLILLALFPVLLLRDFTPANELRYLSIADEALGNGTFFTFSNHGSAYADKPPLFFWFIMLGRWLFGGHCMLFLSLCSLGAAFITASTMDRWAAREISPEYRLSAKLMLLSCGLFLGLAIFVRMDMLMCMFIVLSLNTFYKMYKGEGNPRTNSLLFPVYVFLGVFSKGPVAFLIPVLSTLVFLLVMGRLRTFGRYWGWKTWLVLLSLCAVWFGCAYAEGGWEYLNNLLFHQTIDRAVDSFHHKEPFHYYFLSIWYSMLPWSLPVIGVVVAGAWRRQFRSELQRFFLTVFISTFLMLSFVSSKIEIYLVPAFPFIVYLAIMQLSGLGWKKWIAALIAVPAFVFCMAAPTIVVLNSMEVAPFLDHGFIYAAAGILTIAGVASFYFIYNRRRISTGINTLAIGLFCALFAGGWAAPRINNLFGYSDLCLKAVELNEPEDVSGYNVWNLSRPENMDVFLHEGVDEVSLEDIEAGRLHNTVLMFKAKNIDQLQEAVPVREVHTIGRYAVAVL